MELETAIRDRRAIRAYKPDPVPTGVLAEVLEQACWSPSWRNTQGWRVWVVTGDALRRFKGPFTRHLIDDAPSRPDMDVPGQAWPDVCMQRTQRMMVIREEAEKAAGLDCSREAKMTRMGDLFGAPCLVVIGFDRRIPQGYAGFDCGAFAQTLCLAAHGKGLGTCMMATAVRFPELLHGMLPGDDDVALVIGIALGYADEAAAINRFPRERASLDEVVTWVD